MTLMIDDRDLDKGPEVLPAPVPPQGGTPLKPVAIISVLIVLFVAAGAWWMSRRTPPAANITPRAVTATDAPIDSAAQLPPAPLPPLSEMDAFLRPLLSALSSRPELARWLATDDLVRQLAMAIDRAATGDSPARDFKVIAPASAFRAAGRGNSRTIDPASYRRYDGLVQTLTSMDASAAARVYKTIRPRLNEAYQGLGHAGRNVDLAVQQTLDILIETPVVKEPVALVETGAASWAFEDPELEELRP